MEEDAAEGSEDILALGGNIELSGFNSLDRSSMFILKKIVGSYVRRISSKTEKLEKVRLTMKPLHSSGFELNAKLIDNGKVYASEVSDRNLFFAVDKVMDKIENMLK